MVDYTLQSSRSLLYTILHFTLKSSRILSLLHLPALLLLVRRQHGQQAESLLLQLVGQGAATASSLLLMAGRHLQGQVNTTQLHLIFCLIFKKKY